MKAVQHEAIQQRAYEIWELSGRQHGLDKEHWEQAERELLDAAPSVKGGVAVKSGAKNGRGLTSESQLAQAADRDSAKAATKSADNRPRASGDSPRPR